MDSGLNDRIRKNSMYILIGKMVTPIVTFLMTAYIVRKLSVDAYGVYNILFATMGYIGLFSSMGIPHIYRRYLPEFNERQEYAHLRTLVAKGVFLRLALTVVFIALIFVLWDPASRLFKLEGEIRYFRLFTPVIIFFLGSQLLGVVLVSLFMHKYFVISMIIHTLVRAGVLMLLIGSGWGLKGLLIGESVAYLLLFGLQGYFYIHKFSRLHPNHRTASFPFKRLFRFGGFSYFDEMGQQILDFSTDFFVISAFLGSHLVGLYAFATHVVDLFARWLPHRLLMDVIGPSFITRHVREESPEELNKMFNLLTKFIAFFNYPLVGGLLVFGDKIIVYVFDPKYLDALHVLWIITAFLALKAFQYPLTLMVQAVERTEINFYSKIFSLYNLAGDILIVGILGIEGVAFVTCSAVLFKNLFIYFFTKNVVAFRLNIKPLLRIALNTSVMVCVLIFLKPMITGLITLFIGCMIGVVVYFVFAYVNKSFSDSEREILNKILPRPVFKF